MLWLHCANRLKGRSPFRGEEGQENPKDPPPFREGGGVGKPTSTIIDFCVFNLLDISVFLCYNKNRIQRE